MKTLDCFRKEREMRIEKLEGSDFSFITGFNSVLCNPEFLMTLKKRTSKNIVGK